VGPRLADLGLPDKDTLFWTPVVFTPPARIPGGGEVIMVQAIGRLKDGVSLDQATAEANTLSGGAKPRPLQRRVSRRAAKAARR
jgi:hypothetical protein